MGLPERLRWEQARRGVGFGLGFLLLLSSMASSASGEEGDWFATAPIEQLLVGWEQAGSRGRERIDARLVSDRNGALESLRSVAQNGGLKEQLLAVSYLGEMRDLGSLSVLERLASASQVASLRVRALVAMEELGDPSALRVARSSLQPPPLDEPLVAAAALLALGSFGEASDLDIARAWLQHSLPIVRLQAAVALARLGDYEGEGVVVELSRSDDPLLAKRATQALGLFESETAARRVAEIVESPNAVWRSYGLVAQHSMSIRKLDEQVRRVELMDLVGDSNRVVAEWALRRLLRTDEVAALSAFRAAESKGPQRARAERLLKLRGAI